MTEKSNETFHPHAVIARNDADMAMLNTPCITAFGIHLCGGKRSLAFTVDGFVAIGVAIGDTGVHTRLTPAGARQFARVLTMAADDADAQAAPAANAQLAATLAKKAPGQ